MQAAKRSGIQKKVADNPEMAEFPEFIRHICYDDYFIENIFDYIGYTEIIVFPPKIIFVY
jgi:hypothetical protein